MLKSSLQFDTDHLITVHKPVAIKIALLENCKNSIGTVQCREFVNFKKRRNFLEIESRSSVMDKQNIHLSMDMFSEICSQLIDQSKYKVDIQGVS